MEELNVPTSLYMWSVHTKPNVKMEYSELFQALKELLFWIVMKGELAFKLFNNVEK